MPPLDEDEIQTSARMTAKQFQEPLLRILGELTNCKADVQVLVEDTYGPVMASMGIPSIDHLGVEDESGQPLVQRLVQWACKNLRKAGLVDLEGRGRWILTPAGAEAALKLLPPPVTTTAPKLTIMTTPTTSRPSYLKDPYFLSLILKQTPCLGQYTSHRGAECATCPISEECRQRQFASFSQIAAKFKTARELDTLSPISTLPTPPIKGAKDNGLTVGPIKKTVDSGLNWNQLHKVMAQEEALCVECSGKIQKGVVCFWVEDTVSQQVSLVHSTCLPEGVTPPT